MTRSAPVQFVPEHVIFTGALALFIIFKWSHLDISFFWDESWVYAPAIQVMADEGPSMGPSAIPTYYSRGHPLLFHFLGGCWIKLFGGSFFSLHAFALAISTVFLTVFYSTTRIIFGVQISLACVLIFITQSVFIAQSSMVLPEVLVMLLAFASIGFYASGNKIRFIFFCSLLLLTKESGVTLLVALCIVSLWEAFNNKEGLSQWVRRDLGIILVPLIPVGIFFIFQYLDEGWVFYPDHMALTIINPGEVGLKLWESFNWIFFGQWRFVLSVIAMLTGGYLYFRGRPIFLLNQKKVDGRFLIISFVFIIVYMVFTAANFFTLRYLIVVLPFIIIWFSVILCNSVFQKSISISLILLIMITSLFYSTYKYTGKINDVNLSYLDFCPLQSQAVEFIEEIEIYDQPLYSYFLMERALDDKYAGYRKTDEPFLILNDWAQQYPSRYEIFSNIEMQPRREAVRQNENSKLIRKWEQGAFWIEVYQVIGE